MCLLFFSFREPYKAAAPTPSFIIIIALVFGEMDLGLKSVCVYHRGGKGLVKPGWERRTGGGGNSSSSKAGRADPYPCPCPPTTDTRDGRPASKQASKGQSARVLCFTDGDCSIFPPPRSRPHANRRVCNHFYGHPAPANTGRQKSGILIIDPPYMVCYGWGARVVFFFAFCVLRFAFCVCMRFDAWLVLVHVLLGLGEGRGGGDGMVGW